MLSWVFGVKPIEVAAPHESDVALKKKKKKKKKKKSSTKKEPVENVTIEDRVENKEVIDEHDSESDSDSDASVGVVETKSVNQEAYNMGISASVLMEARSNSSTITDPIKMIIEDVQKLTTNRGISGYSEEVIRNCVMKMFDNSLNYNNSEEVLEQLLQNKNASPKNTANRKAPSTASIASVNVQAKPSAPVETVSPVVNTVNQVKVKSAKPVTTNLTIFEEIVSNQPPIEAVKLMTTKLGDERSKNELFACKALEMLLHKILIKAGGTTADIAAFKSLMASLLQHKGESNEYILEVIGNSLEKITKDINDYGDASHALDSTVDIISIRVVGMLKSSYDELKNRHNQTPPDLHLKAKLEKSDHELSCVINELQRMTISGTQDARMLMVNADLETDKLLLSIETLEIFHMAKASCIVPKNKAASSLPSSSSKQIESQIFSSLGETAESMNEKLSRQSGIKNQINQINRESVDKLRPLEDEIGKINHSINNLAAEKEMLLKKIHSIDVELNGVKNRRTTLEGACADIIAGRDKQLEKLYSHDKDYVKISKLNNFGTSIKNNLATLESTITTYLCNDPASVELATVLSSTAEYNRNQTLQNSVIPYLESQVAIIEFMSRRVYLSKEKIEYVREEIKEYTKLKLPLQVKENEEIIATLHENIIEDVNSLQGIQNVVIDHVHKWSQAMQATKGIGAKSIAHLLPNNQLSLFRGCIQRIITAFTEAKVETSPEFYSLLHN